MNFWRKKRPQNPVQLAVEHHAAGRLEESEALCREALRNDPEDFEALRLLGTMRLRAGMWKDAIEIFCRVLAERPADAAAQNSLGDAFSAVGDLENALSCYLAATQADPDFSEAYNNLGVTYARQQDPSRAERYFARATAIEPEWAVPHFNLGLSLKEQHSIEPALSQFRTAWLLDPAMMEAMRECANAAAQLARANSAYEAPPIARTAGGQASVSIVFCSINDTKHAATVALYERAFAGVPHELIPIRDARSLAEAYNRGIAASKGDVIVLSHDDVGILAPDFAQRLLGHLSRFDVVGAIGAIDVSGPTWRWSGHPHLRGWITHRSPHEDKWYAAAVDPRPIAGDVRVLDGVFLAAHRSVCEDIAFDEETFDGFHLYDIDWTYRVAQAGYRLAAAGDLLIVHASRGRFGADWARYATAFCEKHSLDSLLPPAPSEWAEVVFHDPAEVRAFFGFLAAPATNESNTSLSLAKHQVAR